MPRFRSSLPKIWYDCTNINLPQLHDSLFGIDIPYPQGRSVQQKSCPVQGMLYIPPVVRFTEVSLTDVDAFRSCLVSTSIYYCELQSAQFLVGPARARRGLMLLTMSISNRDRVLSVGIPRTFLFCLGLSGLPFRASSVQDPNAAVVSLLGTDETVQRHPIKSNHSLINRI